MGLQGGRQPLYRRKLVPAAARSRIPMTMIKRVAVDEGELVNATGGVAVATDDGMSNTLPNQ
jgi:hypothetical protein